MGKIVVNAADGLALQVDDSGFCRLGWGEPDWFGPAGLTVAHRGATVAGTIANRNERDDGDELGHHRAVELTWLDLPFPLRTTARAYADRSLIVFRLAAPDGLRGAGSGRFGAPIVAWPHFAPLQRHAGGVSPRTASYAHQWTEFSLPVFGDADTRGFRFAPHRPPVVTPFMLIAPDGRTLLLAPLDHFHEQIVAVPADADGLGSGVRCGWHGDLANAPPGFATELGVWAAGGPRAALDLWIGFLRDRYGSERPSRYADVGLSRLSYWTDNGAHYYYRTEPEADYLTTLERVVGDCEQRGIPIGMVQIDSWFYPHEHLRPVSADGAPIVPPSGMMRWEPREDLFPDGFGDLQRRLGNRPLAFHSRHFARRSPYFDGAAQPAPDTQEQRATPNAECATPYAAWVDGDYAHPRDGALFDRMLGSAAVWGAITYEQDWMVESFLGVRGVREAPGRARDWQEQLDGAAAAHGLTLQWCMSTPADFLQSTTLRRLTSIRTSGDYRYLFDNGLNWVWFLHTNALARALGLNAFKDVFLSDRDAEPYAEIEALLAALSTGPVGIGDRLGRADRALVLRTCREDGMLVKPDAPIAAIDACFRSPTYLAEQLLVGETYSHHPAGRWVYVVALHASRSRDPIAQRISLAELGAQQPPGAVIAYDWRSGSWQRLERDGGWDVQLAWQDWDYRVLCPLLPGDRAVFGDVGRYATAGDRRLANLSSSAAAVCFDVLGAPGTTATVRGGAPSPPRAVDVAAAGLRRAVSRRDDGEGWSWSDADGGWAVRVDMQRSDTVRVRVAW
jgi:hypothetical protein